MHCLTMVRSAFCICLRRGGFDGLTCRCWAVCSVVDNDCVDEGERSLAEASKFVSARAEASYLLSSIYPQQATVFTQEDTNQSVRTLADEFVPKLRRCQKEKSREIIREARERVQAYVAGLETLREQELDRDGACVAIGIQCDCRLLIGLMGFIAQ